MSWAAARRYLFPGVAATVSLTSASYVLKRTIYADNEPPTSENGQNGKRPDPLTSFDWMASYSFRWKDSKLQRCEYASLPNKAEKYVSLTFNCVPMSHGANWVYVILSEGVRGWETSVFVLRALIPTITSGLNSLLNKYVVSSGDSTGMETSAKMESEIPEEEMDEAIKTAFRSVDHGAVNQAKDMALSSPSKSLNVTQLSAALAGSTGMFVLYDEEQLLKVANAGDARAVLGRPVKRADGTQGVEVHILNSEHTSTNPTEQNRLRNSHPGVDLSVLRNYIGRDLTRAFGLAMCKWSKEVQERIHKEYLGEAPPRDLQPNLPEADTNQQPYLTAEPEITTFQVEPNDFLIIGNKGFWNSLTSEEAVGLVAVWLLRKVWAMQEPVVEEPSDVHIVERLSLPVDLSAEDTTVWYNRWKVPKRFIAMDRDASVHLIRNALGGANRVLTESLLRIPNPSSANSRDELVVAVLFF